MKATATFFFGALLLSSATNAQVSQSDLPQAGDTITYVEANALGTSTGTSGSGQTWDYSNLQSNGSLREDFVSVTDAGFTYALTFGFPFSSSYSDMGKKGEIPLPELLLNTINSLGLGITFGETYNFMKRSGDGLYQTGFGADVSGFGLPVQYSEHDQLIPLPLTLNATSNSTYSFSVELPTLGNWTCDAERINEVNGVGTLILPNATYENVYRIKSALNSTNTISSDQLPSFISGIPLPRNEVKYLYMAPGVGWPVLEITAASLFGQEIVSKVIYRAVPVDDTSVPESIMSGIEVYPVPASDFISVKSDLKITDKLTYQVLDASGRIIHTQSREALAGPTTEVISIASLNLADGIYFLKITPQSGRPEVKPLVIQKQ